MRRHALIASLSAAAPVALAYGVLYGSALAFLGWVAGPIAGFFAFLAALFVSPVFLAARSRLPEPWYFLMHLSIGWLLGILIAFIDPRTDSSSELFASRETTLPLVASISAWLYLYLFASSELSEPNAGKLLRIFKMSIYTFAIATLSYLPILRPYIEDDRCHNVLRDQRSSNRANESIHLSLPIDAEAELKAYYAEFALKHQLDAIGHSINKTSAQSSMCNARVTIKAGGFFEGRHRVGVYEMAPDSEWQILAEEMVCDFKSKWPGSVQFSDGGGYKHDRPRQLTAHCISSE